MQLSAVQIRTFSCLLDVGVGEEFPAGLEPALRRRIEEGIGPVLPLPQPVVLAKGRLNALDRCEGLYDAELLGEGPTFRHSGRSAAGTLTHRTIEMDIALQQQLQPFELAERAAAGLAGDRHFAPYWEGLDRMARGELVMQAVRGIEQFRASFPPVRAFRRRLAPVTELWLESRFGGGAVRVRGKVDLLLGAARPARSTRVLIDLKRGRPRPEHPEDMRLYALLHTLRCGTPPCRAATFFLSSGEWQAEDVTEEVLVHAANRVVRAVRSTAARAEGGSRRLQGGPHCAWCPRRVACPAADPRAGLATDG